MILNVWRWEHKLKVLFQASTHENKKSPAEQSTGLFCMSDILVQPSIYQFPSFCFTIPEINLLSALPASCLAAIPITLPMSFMVAAPVSSIIC